MEPDTTRTTAPTEDLLTNYDYRFIRYYQDEDGAIWSGPHSPEDNLHWGKVDGSGVMVLSRSYRETHWAEISPQQAARILQLRKMNLNRAI